MKEHSEIDYDKLIDLDAIKEFCAIHIEDIVFGGLRLDTRLPKVRYINSDGKFGYTSVSRILFFGGCMYMLTQDERYESEHNSDIMNSTEELRFLFLLQEYLVRVVFAGIFTGFYDDDDFRIFTGDVVDARVIINPTRYSLGGKDRAVCNEQSDATGTRLIAGVEDLFGTYSIILDNHHIPLAWALRLKVVGNLFYDLKPGVMEVDIFSLCSSYAQERNEERIKLRKLIEKAPNFRV